MMGVLVSEATNPVYAAMIHGIEQAVSAEGYQLLLASSGWTSSRERLAIQGLVGRKIDGLALALCDDQDASTVAMIRSLRIPVVLLDRDLPGESHDSVLVDHRRGILQAVQYLVHLGHERIGLICGLPSIRPARERLKGYQEALSAHGIAYQPELVKRCSSADQFCQWTGSDILALPDPPTAVIAAGHRFGVGLLEAIRSKGLRIPTDCSVVAYDDIDVFRLNDPGITVIQRDSIETGRLAGQALLDRVWSGRSGGRKMYLPTRLIVRGSCAPTPTRVPAGPLRRLAPSTHRISGVSTSTLVRPAPPTQW
jgi:LacI family transcriptional regulator